MISLIESALLYGISQSRGFFWNRRVIQESDESFLEAEASALLPLPDKFIVLWKTCHSWFVQLCFPENHTD